MIQDLPIRKIIHVALELVVDEIEDYFTPEFRDEEELLSLHDALEQVHQPDDKKNLQNAIVCITLNQRKKFCCILFTVFIYLPVFNKQIN